MASAEFLEEALSNNVDESAVSAIVGSLETQLGKQGKPPPSPQSLANGAQLQAPGPAYQQKAPEPLKLMYPPSQASQPGNMNVNSRVVYTSQALPNRTISLAPFSPNMLPGGIMTQAMGKPVQIQSPLILKPGNNPVNIRPNIVMSNTQANTTQNIVTTQTIMGNPHGTLPANVQIVNVRPGTPVGGQKSVAAVSPRVVIGAPQLMGTRPAGPHGGITLQTLQGFQPGQQGHLLLKTENGQFQLLRVGPPGQNQSHAGAAIRLQAVPQQANSSTAPLGLLPGQTIQQTTSVSSPAPMPPPQIQQAPQLAPSPQQVRPPQPNQTQFVAVSAAQSQKVSVENLKEKCRKFLSNLLDLSSKEPKDVERNVRILIQELIDMKVEPEAFCARLEKLLDASPQPCLIGFLKKTLPILRQSLVNKELVIEGIHPPPANLVFSNASTPSSPTVLNTSSTMGQPSYMSAPPPLQTPVRPVAPPASSAAKSITPIRKGNQNTNKTFVKLSSLPSASPGLAKQSKDKDKKSGLSSFAQPSFTDMDKMAGDDDINDVAAMGGVNLAEESQRILRSTEMIGTQIRSCKDEYLASMGPLQLRLKQIAAKHGLEEPGFDVAALMSHAMQERLKNMMEKLACTSQHRLDVIKLNPNYEVTQDVKGQLKFLEDLDRVERKRREDYEREILLRAAKSRSKSEDPEQVKLKEKAKEMQRAEMEEMRQREANLTALQAIGPRKKPRLLGHNQADTAASADSTSAEAGPGKGGATRGTAPVRARMKRVNYRDLLFLLEQERETVRSELLYKCYLK